MLVLLCLYFCDGGRDSHFLRRKEEVTGENCNEKKEEEDQQKWCLSVGSCCLCGDDRMEEEGQR